MKNKKNNLKIGFLIICMIVIIIFIIYYYATKDNIFEKYKADKNKNIVYPIYQSGETSVPVINVKGVGVDAVNETIINKANEFLTGRNTITYNFEINGKILSLAIQYVDYYDEEEINPMIYYDIYNINFYESKVLNDSDMLDLYGITEDAAKNIVEAKFIEFYNDELEKKYFNNECDYDCFLALRGIKDEKFMDDAYYYIKNGNLYVIKPFKIYSPFGEEKYFSTKDFLIQITE